jgi:hypothetical protein
MNLLINASIRRESAASADLTIVPRAAVTRKQNRTRIS